MDNNIHAAIRHLEGLVNDFGNKCGCCKRALSLVKEHAGQSPSVAEIRTELTRMIEEVHRDRKLPVMDRKAWTTDGAILYELERLRDFIDGRGEE